MTTENTIEQIDQRLNEINDLLQMYYNGDRDIDPSEAARMRKERDDLIYKRILITNGVKKKKKR